MLDNTPEKQLRELPILVKLVLVVFLICVIPPWEYYCVNTLFPAFMEVAGIDHVRAPIIGVVVLSLFLLFFIIALILFAFFCVFFLVSRIFKAILPSSKQFKQPRKW
ncbi:MAG: hypothetical protein KGO49_07340 [Gammaproteobacteria bacterium]|nr:hypothetical protein [Gammaproteobacteria bacterium]